MERVPAVSSAYRLAIAALIGVAIALSIHVWERLRASPPIVPLSGRVMLDGQPLNNAYVKFSPVPRSGESPLDTNAGSHCFTDAQGNFTLLQIANDQPGVIVGEHKIAFRTGTFQGNGYVGERVPFTWRQGMRFYRVPWTGSDEATFCIQTKLPAGDAAASGD